MWKKCSSKKKSSGTNTTVGAFRTIIMVIKMMNETLTSWFLLLSVSGDKSGVVEFHLGRWHSTIVPIAPDNVCIANYKPPDNFPTKYLFIF
jgi:hypothetical protein